MEISGAVPCHPSQRPAGARQPRRETFPSKDRESEKMTAVAKKGDWQGGAGMILQWEQLRRQEAGEVGRMVRRWSDGIAELSKKGEMKIERET